MPYLPERPYRLKKDYARKQLGNAWLVLAVTLALGVGMTVYGASQVRGLLASAALWHRGEVAREAQVGGKVETTRWLGFIDVFHEYDLDVTYRDAAGAEHRARVEAMSFLEEGATDEDPVVRYDPDDPERVAVSWVADLSYGPVLWASWTLFLGPLLVFVGFVFLRMARRKVRSAVACAARGNEIEVTIRALQKLGGAAGLAGKHRLVYELPADVRRRGGKREVVLDGMPIVVGPPGAQRAIALACPGAPDPTFPLADLDPYDATPAQRAALAAALARGA